MIGIVFHKRIATLQAGAHHFHGTNECRCLPVALSPESIPLFHQPLYGNAWQLGYPMQVFKCIGEAFEISRFKKLTQARLETGRLTERRVARSVLLKVSGDRIAVVILRHEGIHFLVGHVVDRGYEVAHAITIDGVSKPDLRLYLVAFGDGNLSHVVAEPAILSALP